MSHSVKRDGKIVLEDRSYGECLNFVMYGNSAGSGGTIIEHEEEDEDES